MIAVVNKMCIAIKTYTIEFEMQLHETLILLSLIFVYWIILFPSGDYKLILQYTIEYRKFQLNNCTLSFNHDCMNNSILV